MLGFLQKGKSVVYKDKTRTFEITIVDKMMLQFLSILTKKNTNVSVKGKKIILKVTSDMEAEEVLSFLKLSGNI